MPSWKCYDCAKRWHPCVGRLFESAGLFLLFFNPYSVEHLFCGADRCPGNGKSDRSVFFGSHGSSESKALGFVFTRNGKEPVSVERILNFLAESTALHSDYIAWVMR